ncbi:MAG: serine/threonine protein kinase [Clostridiales Family XIII bacterium]|jgi:hypothetical protein|nr:serine/threonine protein kinase [Clostridiales Family XIII bacterium]
MEIQNLKAVWPDWEVEDLIGEGSFGSVYRARREVGGIISHAAIKAIRIPQNEGEVNRLRSEGFDTAAVREYYREMVENYKREIKVMQAMKGQTNIVSVEDFHVQEDPGQIGYRLFIRMELLTSFVDYMAGAELSEADVVKLGIDICSALELCEKNNVIHRDIKPENLFVTDFGDFKVGDFGIARKLDRPDASLTRTGTRDYIAPEIESSQRYDATVDIYSLGLVLYKLLNNNRLPFLDANARHVSHTERAEAFEKRIAGAPLPRPVNASASLANIILTACAHNPAERFQHAAAMKRALLSLSAEGGGAAAMAPEAAAAPAQAAAEPVAAAVAEEAPAAEPVAEPEPAPAPAKKRASKRPVVVAFLVSIVCAFGAGAVLSPTLQGWAEDLLPGFAGEKPAAEEAEAGSGPIGDIGLPVEEPAGGSATGKAPDGFVGDALDADDAVDTGNALAADLGPTDEDIFPDNAPTALLSSMFLVDSQRYEYKTAPLTDSFGDEYYDFHEFIPVGRSDSAKTIEEMYEKSTAAYAVFNLKQQYRQFSADLVVPTGTSSDAYFLVEALVDDDPAPVAIVRDFTVRTGTVHIDANVDGAQKLTIRVRKVMTDGRSNDSTAACLVNTELTR